MKTIKDLVNVIKAAAQSYYEGEPVMSDQEFDGLVEILRNKRPDHAILSTPGWGYVPPDHLKKFTHLFHVGSLDKIKQADYVKDKKLPYNDFIMSLKLDGGSAVAYYHEGQLARILSRGDGAVGLDITANLSHGNTVPTSIEDKTLIAVRGEVVLTLEAFDEIGGSNPRNVAVGLSQSKSGDPELLSHLRFVACSVAVRSVRNRGYKLFDDLRLLSSLGFLVVPHRYTEFTEFEKHVKKDTKPATVRKLTSLGSKENYPIDGLVLSKHTTVVTAQNGVTITPSTAFKFDDQIKATTVKAIEWNVGRTGRVVPVALVEPVKVEGAVVRRVTMNNWTFLQENGVGPGAKIEIVRSNMVIPMLVSTEKRVDAVQPHDCPSCANKLTVNGRDLVCEYEGCPAKDSGALRVFWNLVKPDKVGPRLLDRLEQDFNLRQVEDVKRWAESFNREDYDGYGTVTVHLLAKMAGNILSFRSTVGTILRIASLGSVGKNVAFAFEYAVTKEQFVKALSKKGPLPDQWEKLAGNYKAFNAIVGNRERLLKLCELFPFAETEGPVPIKVRVCLTGALSKPRTSLLKEWAGKGVVDASASSCDVLVADSPSSSSKYVTAVKRGIPILTEAEFSERYL